MTFLRGKYVNPASCCSLYDELPAKRSKSNPAANTPAFASQPVPLHPVLGQRERGKASSRKAKLEGRLSWAAVRNHSFTCRSGVFVNIQEDGNATLGKECRVPAFLLN